MQRAQRVVGQLLPNEVAAPEQKEVVSINVQNGVAVLVINNPPVNSYSGAVHAGLAAAFKKVSSDAAVKAIVLTGAGAFFMAGADIPSIQQMQKSGDKRAIREFLTAGNELLSSIEAGSKPVVAAVNGQAFGGGLELAMACHARVGSSKSAYALPELKLGIIPGFGGTQRLPRLIGLKDAVEATLGSKTIKPDVALKSGLIDELVKNPKDLLMAAGKLALSLVGKKDRRRSLLLNDKLPSYEDAKPLLDAARLDAARKSKNAPHPAAFLDAVAEGLQHGGAAGIKKEIALMTELIPGPVAKGLVHFFLASKETAKIPGLKEKGKPIKCVAVLGGGTMGSGIAITLLMKGYKVILKEINEKFLLQGVERIMNTIAGVIKSRRLPPFLLEGALRNLQPQITYDGFDEVDLVIEAAVENIALKQQIFADLERVCRKDCLLSTNTSTIDITLVGAKTQAQDRIIGLHYFSPAHVMPLLEIVRSKFTSNSTLAASVELAKVTGKTPVVVGNCVGFTANRIFFPYGQAASFLVDFGVDPYRIDKALLKFQMPMGVLAMADLSGNDIFVHVGKIINEAYGSRCYNSTMGQKLVAAGRLGQKAGKGWYQYKGRQAVPDPKGIAPLLAAARADKGNPASLDAKLTDKDIIEITLFTVANEACRVVDEGHVIRPSDVDIVSVMGYGFPATRGGILHWAANVEGGGFRYVRDRLKYFGQTFGALDKSLASFFAPCAYLEKVASGN